MSTLPEEIRIWLVEDNETYRRGLVRTISSSKGMSCVGEFSRAESVLEAINQRPAPDVILLDIGLPGMDGLVALEQFRKRIPDSRVVILTVSSDPDTIFKAVCAGAGGYLLKTSSPELLMTGVRQAAEGDAPMDAGVAARVLDLFEQFPKHRIAQVDDYDLTAREKEVLEKMAEGLVTKEIADVFDVSYHAITNQIRSIYTKLHVTTGTGAVAKAIRDGLV